MRFSNQVIRCGMRRRPFVLNCDPGQEMESEKSSWGWGMHRLQKILGYEREHALAYTEEGILDALWLPGSEGHKAGETGGKR